MTGQVVFSFFAYDSGFHGGVFVAAADFNGDGKADVVTGAGPGGGPARHASSAGRTRPRLFNFFAYDAGFHGGVFVAAGERDRRRHARRGDRGPAPAAGRPSRRFDGKTGAELLSFYAFDAKYAGGVTVAVGDVDGDGDQDIIAGRQRRRRPATSRRSTSPPRRR